MQAAGLHIYTVGREKEGDMRVSYTDTNQIGERRQEGE